MMNGLRQWFREWLAVPVSPPKETRRRVSFDTLYGMARPELARHASEHSSVFNPSTPAPGVVPAGMAADSNCGWGSQGAALQAFAVEGSCFEGITFLGYPYLSELSQRPEYRRPSETIARHMLRKGFKLQATGEEDKTDRLQELQAELDRLKVSDTLLRMVELDGFFGRSQVYLDTGHGDDRDELVTPLTLTPEKIGRKSLKRLVVIEPIWTYPSRYNATDPLDPNYYRPDAWLVMGKEIHRSRLLTMVARPVPDMLKPAYQFGGVSLTQMLKPYVDNWLRTRQSVSDLLHSFSTMVVSTNLEAVLSGATGAGQDLLSRLQLFNVTRDNQGLLVLDKNTEAFDNVAAPISGLDHLQAQAQEHMCAVTGIPLVVAFGITPSGLNATSEGELQCFDDWIEALRESVVDPVLTHVIKAVMLSLWGEIDLGITHRWESLRTPTPKELSELRKTDVDADCSLIDHGVLLPDEVRNRLAADDDSPYAALDLAKEIPSQEESHSHELDEASES